LLIPLALCGLVMPLGAVPEGVDSLLAADAQTFTLKAPGFSSLQGQFSARIKAGGQMLELSSASGIAAGPVEWVTEATPYGQAEIATATLWFEKEQVNLMIRLGRVRGLPGVLVQTGIRNSGAQPFDLLVLRPCEITGRVLGNPADWLATSIHPVDGFQTTLEDIVEPLHFWESGAFYRRDGIGLFIGPVGQPISYLNTRIAHGDGVGSFSLRIAAQMSGVRVDPGEVRWGQQVLLLMEKPQPAMARWTEWVAKTHGARTDKGALSGWSSWYFLGGGITGGDVLEVADAALKEPRRLHPQVIQIDGGYEDSVGQKETNEKFPEGLAFYAQRIAATGARPGLQVNLPSLPGEPALLDSRSWSELTERVRQAVQRGYTYLKIDLYEIQAVAGKDTKKTSFESMREGFGGLREAAGEETYLLHCDSHPDRATVGLVDASRTGRAADRNSIRNAMTDVLRSYQYQGRWFAVDNCNYYMGTDVLNISAILGGWPVVRTWMSMVGMSCGTAITSDPWQWESFQLYWHNVEAMTPPAQERTEVLDLCAAEEWPRLVSRIQRRWGSSIVSLLWNPGNIESIMSLDFAQAGMDPQRRYAVWSYWDNRYLGVAKGTWNTPALAPAASQHLCFTDLDQTPNQPVLIGSNLHIFCGAAEIKDVVSKHGSMEIALTDAGARSGDLFVYSHFPLVVDNSHGCEVLGIAQAGEFVWRVSLADRLRGMPQKIELKVLLPVTQRIWFWLLIATVLISVVFSGWRYVAVLRLQRRHALDQERSRIARDLHDEIGASLTHISILSSIAAKPTTEAKVSFRHSAEVASVAQQTILAFDEVLWSINPENDTLQSLCHYLCRRTEEFLAPTEIHHQFLLDDALPNPPVPPQSRHGLLLAFKEALHNILKHSGATLIKLECRMEGMTFVVRLSDNGCGFDAKEQGVPIGRRRHGLANMKHRLKDLGGDCRIESSAGHGTQITFQLPVD
jgi:signal transduction histidine kinase